MHLGLSQFAAKKMMLFQLQAKLLEPAKGVLVAPFFRKPTILVMTPQEEDSGDYL